MTKYIVKMIIDRWPVGEDVTNRYQPNVLQRLINEGYIEVVTDEATTEETATLPESPSATEEDN
jgi:hypothetical protein